MRALVLAAGFGTRLGALASERPKPLLPVGTTTPLDVVLDRLEDLPGLERVDLWTNQRFLPAFEAWAADRHSRLSIEIRGNGVTSLADRRGAMADLDLFLRSARPQGALLVVGGDQVFDGSLAALASAARHEPVVAVHDVGSRERVSRYASVRLDPAGRVLELVEKDPAPPGTWAVPAIYGLPPETLPDVARYLRAGGHPDNLGHFAAWWATQRVVRGVVLPGRWIDVGSPEEYARARREFGGEVRPPVR